MGLDWKPISEAPKPYQWNEDAPYQRYIVAQFYQEIDEDGEPVGAPEMRWAQCVSLSFDGWHVDTHGFAGTHGHASFVLSSLAGTHFALLPLTLSEGGQ